MSGGCFKAGFVMECVNFPWFKYADIEYIVL